MKRADKPLAAAAALLVLLTLSASPANAQGPGFPGGGEDMMTQMAPMLEMMKAKMGKKRFAAVMQTMGPMMTQMMQNGGFAGMGGYGGMSSGGMSSDLGGIMGGGYNMGGMDIGSMMGMIAPVMQMAHFGDGHHRRHRRHQ